MRQASRRVLGGLWIPIQMKPTAKAARELVERRGVGVLATISSRLAGYPYGSLTNYAVDDHGRPLFLFSTLAVHTGNLAAGTESQSAGV